MNPINCKAIEVANVQILQCKQNCNNLEWEMKGSMFQDEVYIINLETYDLISEVLSFRLRIALCARLITFSTIPTRLRRFLSRVIVDFIICGVVC